MVWGLYRLDGALKRVVQVAHGTGLQGPQLVDQVFRQVPVELLLALKPAEALRNIWVYEVFLLFLWWLLGLHTQ